MFELIIKILKIVAFIIILLAFSWIITCGMIYLILLCFGIKFSWLIATGIWLILCLLGKAFNIATNEK